VHFDILVHQKVAPPEPVPLRNVSFFWLMMTVPPLMAATCVSLLCELAYHKMCCYSTSPATHLDGISVITGCGGRKWRSKSALADVGVTTYGVGK
jgi:hypothetical protein